MIYLLNQINKMKNILLIILLLIFILEIRAQTTDPAVAALLKEIAILKYKSNTVQTKIWIAQKRMEIIQRTILKAREKYDWIKKIEMIKEINDLLETMICNQQDLEFYLGLNDSYGCLVQVDYDLILLDITTSYDVLYLLLGAGLSMSSGERIKSLMDVVALLRKTNEKIISFNSRIKFRVNAAFQERYFKKLLGEYNGSYRYSRYTPVN